VFLLPEIEKSEINQIEEKRYNQKFVHSWNNYIVFKSQSLAIAIIQKELL